MANKPIELTHDDWVEINAIEDIRDFWSLEPGQTLEGISDAIYAVKFKFESGSIGYHGDLYILQGDGLNGVPPVMLIRGANGKLKVLKWTHDLNLVS